MVTDTLRQLVLRRDGFRCMGPVLDGSQTGLCRDAFGNPIRSDFRVGNDPGPVYLQMSHTKGEGELSMSKKATDDAQHLITLCPWHHTGTQGGWNWEVRNRWRIRQHLGIDGRHA